MGEDSNEYSSLDQIFADDDGLLDTPEKPQPLTNVDRLERSFVEILDFVRENDREPSPTTMQISERKLGARLEGIRANPEKVEALAQLDDLGLLNEAEAPESLEDLFELDEDLDGLSLLDDDLGIMDTSALPAPRRSPEDTGPGAQRHKSENFDQYEPLFKQKHADLAYGVSQLVPFGGLGRIVPGAFFVLNGVMAFVVEVGDSTYKKIAAGEVRRERLRVIFENGTESAMYRQSLAVRLTEDAAAREVVDVDYQEVADDDIATGWVYILRSLSDDPQIAGRENLYKIGFTKRPVDERIANASKDPTYLMAPVQVVETYRTYNLRASALEHLLHRVFARSRLQIRQTGLDGRDYDVTEWFEVPLSAIREAAELIVSGDIVDYEYDAKSGRLRRRM